MIAQLILFIIISFTCFVYMSFTDSKELTVSINYPPTEGLVKYDWIAAWACIALFFLILTVFAVLETYVINFM